MSASERQEIYELGQTLGDRGEQIKALLDRIQDLEAAIEQQEALFAQPSNTTKL
jgi:hypothetical protein